MPSKVSEGRLSGDVALLITLLQDFMLLALNTPLFVELELRLDNELVVALVRELLMALAVPLVPKMLQLLARVVVVMAVGVGVVLVGVGQMMPLALGVSAEPLG